MEQLFKFKYTGGYMSKNLKAFFITNLSMWSLCDRILEVTISDI